MNSKVLLLHSLLVISFFGSTRAAQPPRWPLPRIETGMHTEQINNSAVDKSGRFALTASSDKTARLWELPSGRLLRVFRPPVAEGHEGRLEAGALNPEGTVAAIAGWTGPEWDKSFSISLFETATGKLLRQLTGLPTVVMDLAFSENGRFLAGALGAGHGLRVWETTDWREIGRDTGYSGHRSRSVAWHADHRLITTAWDGALRLYEVTEGRVWPLRRVWFGTRRLSGARFSPDGRRIAVCFNALFSKTIPALVVDAENLSTLFKPYSTGQIIGDLGSAVWSGDGRTLVAAGFLDLESVPISKDPKSAIHCWSQSGRGQPRSYPATRNTVTDIRPLPGGGFFFAAADPAWGVLSSSGQPKVLGTSPIAIYAGLKDNFRISADGGTLTFAYEHFGKTPAKFSVTDRKLELGTNGVNKTIMHGPRVSGLQLTNWYNGFPPRLNGKPLPMPTFEASRSIAISRDASCFLHGTEFTVRRFTAEGEQEWERSAPGVVWALNFTANDQLAVAAYGDGTIRWHRADTGEELLAFFPHADRIRWVIWTPEGYYDCSPGGEDLLGWHLNRDKTQSADFFPASRFRAMYYRPDVIQRVLKTLDTTEALLQANAAWGKPAVAPEGLRDVIGRLSPPIVELASGGVLGKVTASKGGHSVAVRYRVRQTGQEKPTAMSVRLNGRPVDVTAPLPADGEEATVDVPLPDGIEGEVSIIAEHKSGASEAAILRLQRKSGSPPAPKPDLYIIACGVAHLQVNEASKDGTVASVRRQGVRKDAEWRLTFDDLLFAGDDAHTFAGLFNGQEGKTYAHVIPTVLVDKQATTAAITDALDDVTQKARLGDVVVVFFSGHGHFIPDPGFLLITHDTSPQNLAGTALTGQELARRLAGIRGSVVLALDTCYSGAVLEGDKQVRVVTGPGDLTGLVNQLSSSEQGVVVISSSAENQSSLEDDREKQGVFTKAIAEGFAGGAAHNGEITCASLQKWIIERVPILAKKIDPKAEQYPACIMPKGVPDFVLAKP